MSFDITTLNIQTNTRYIDNTFTNAPALNNTWGDLARLIKAICVDGFNPNNIISVTIDSTTLLATITFGKDPGFTFNQVIQITGSEQDTFNGYYRVLDNYSKPNSVIVKLNNTITTIPTGTMIAKTAPLGYAMPWEDIANSGRIVLKNKSTKSPAYLKIIDAPGPNGYNVGWAKYARVAIGQQMSDIKTFVNNEKSPLTTPNFPDPEETGNGVNGENGIHGFLKWDYALNGSSNPYEYWGPSGVYPTRWKIIGDDKNFYLSIASCGNNYNGMNVLGFGNYLPSFKDETYNIIAHGSSRWYSPNQIDDYAGPMTRNGFTCPNHWAGGYLFKNVYGECQDNLFCRLMTMYQSWEDPSNPSNDSRINGYDYRTGKLLTTPIYIKDAQGDFRGSLRGIEQLYGLNSFRDKSFIDNYSKMIITFQKRYQSSNGAIDDQAFYVFPLTNWEDV